MVLADPYRRYCTKRLTSGYPTGVLLVHRNPTLHNDGMNNMTKKLRIVAALLLAVFVIAGMTGCGDEPVNIDEQQVLASASAKMKEIPGLHFEYEVHQAESVKKQNGIVSIAGEVSASGEMQATVTIYAGGFLVNADFIALGDTHYIKYPLSPSWTSVAAAKSPVGTLNLATGTIRILERIVDAKYVGTEKKDGRADVPHHRHRRGSRSAGDRRCHQYRDSHFPQTSGSAWTTAWSMRSTSKDPRCPAKTPASGAVSYLSR